MTEYIAHRKNTIAELQATPTQYGIEVDIRSHGTELIIHHDAFKSGESFETWLAHYQHGTLILNVKEEGLESRLLDLMQTYSIKNYFFLDQSFPFLIKLSKEGKRCSAVRVSEYESVKTALTLTGKIDWVWVDCFTKFPLTYQEAQQLKQAGFKLCLVSPELQGRHHGIEAMHALLLAEDITVDAVCTKHPEVWEVLEQIHREKMTGVLSQ